MQRIQLTHIITGLSLGGAELVLLRFLQSTDKSQFDNRVISLTDDGLVASEIKKLDIPVEFMGFENNEINVRPLMRLAATLKRHDPDIVQTWMYHADLIGGGLARLCTKAPVLWNLRQSNLDKQYSKRSTILTANACAKLSSSIPETIVCGSEAARHVHSDLGYDSTRMTVLHNGFDTERYQYSADVRKSVRADLGVDDDTILFGNPSRFNPQKDHTTMIEAFAKTLGQLPNAKLALCGIDISENNEELTLLINQHMLAEQVILLNSLADMTQFYSALDIMVLSSAYGEGSPNALGEAMSSSIPCISTNVGDCALMVGESGTIVPPRNASALADAMIAMACESPEQRKARGTKARRRILDTFPLQTMVDRYEATYRRVYSQRYDF